MTTHHQLVTGYLKYHRSSKISPVTIIITGYLKLITSSLLIGDPPPTSNHYQLLTDSLPLNIPVAETLTPQHFQIGSSHPPVTILDNRLV
ncbi:MAG: hypothetical protein F6J86_14690 [Symploca sp. SIO1B1]|nr:hypothetical protein [Symploca sp. SIO1B1]